MIVVYGPNSVVAMTDAGWAQVTVDNDAAHSLTGSGDPATLRAVMRRAEAFCKSGTMVCVVEHGNPHKEKLTSIYQRFGFKDIGIIMKRRLKWAE